MPADMTKALEERIRAAVSYDPESGLLTRKVAVGGSVPGGRAGWVSSRGYRTVSVAGRRFQEHRLAWFLYYGRWPSQYIDHIDGDRQNNRITNLRDVSWLANTQNIRKPPRTNTSGYLGVRRVQSSTVRPWRATIRVRGEVKCLGVFETPDQAHAAYIEAKRMYHEGNTL